VEISMTKQLVFKAFTLVLVAGCGGDDEGGSTADARPPTIDARVGTVDAPAGGADAAPLPDAAPSTVVVTPDCTGVPQGQIDLELTTTGLAFSQTAITLPAGSIIRFTTAGSHNFASSPGVDAPFVFKSGAVGAHTACLTFPVATGGPINFRCDLHTTSMTGTLTIN
jgi:plastocyanin